MPEVVLRLAGDNISAIRAAQATIAELRGIKVETEEIGASTKTTSATIAETARLNVTRAIEQREALKGLVQEYATVTKTAAAGSEEARVANRLWMESNAKLAATYDAVGVSAKRAADESVAASARAREESGVARGFASRTFGLTAFAGGAFIAGAAAGLAIKKSSDEAIRAQESQAQLRNALDRTGQSYAAQRDEIEKYLVVAEKQSAFDRIDLRTSLGQLIRTTGDTQKAQELLSQATDVARGRHISLDTAVRLVTRAYEGSIGSLARVGIHIDAVTTSQDKLREAHIKTTPEMVKQAKELDRQATATAALKKLNDLYSGSAEAHARTLSGREEALSNAFTDVSVAIGRAVTPALSRMFEWMAKTIEAATRSQKVHTVLHDTFKVIGDVIGAVVDDLKLLFDVYEAVAHAVHSQLVPALLLIANFALPAITAALAAMPWTAVLTIAVIAATEIVRHWGTVRQWFGTFWRWLKGISDATWDAMKGVAYGAVYAILNYATAAIRGILELASHLPFVGDKAKAALDSINGYLDSWKARSAAQFAQAGADLGNAFGSSFQQQVAAHIRNTKGYLSSGAGADAALRRGVTRGSSASGTGGETSSSIQTGLVQTGLGAVGVPYAFGGTPSISSPTDCSGLMVAIFARHGIRLPRTSEAQYSDAPIKNEQPLAIGDLVFSEGIHPGHVGLYIGGGKVLEDPHTGDHVKVIALADFGWNGESARWWGGARRAGHGGGGVSTPEPTQASLDKAIAGAAPSSTPATPAYKGPTGDALLPAALVRRARRFAAAASQDLSAAGSASGSDIANFYQRAADDLRREESVLRDELASLDRRLKGASGGRKKAIQAEIAKVESNIASVHKAVQSALGQEENALQSSVSTLQSNVSTSFSTIQQAIIARFEANTQALVDAAGRRFFQGSLTPEEARLQAAQNADQVQSLQDALAQARASGDPAQIKAAQHAIDMYNLEAAAAKSRAQADADYAAAVAKIQKDREAQEEHLSVDLDKFGAGLQDGTNKLSDLQPLLNSYGVNVSDLAKSSYTFKTTLDNLSDSVRALDGALLDLGELVATITGKPFHRPGHHPTSSSGGGGSTGGGSTGGSPSPPAPHFAGGGIVPGPMIGPEDTIMARVSTGEGIASRDEMRMLLAAAIGRTHSAAPPIRQAPIYVLGATENQVARALARIVTPGQNRSIGFKTYTG